MSSNDIIQLINQLCSFERDVRRSLLKVLYLKHFIFVLLAAPVLVDMIIKTMSHVGAVVRYGLAIKDHQHSSKIG